MIETRARCAARTRPHALMKPCHELDRKSRSADSHYQSSTAQLQKRWALPFAYRHRRSLLPQFSVSAGSGCQVMACAFASPNGTAPEAYANAGITHGRGGLPIQLSIRMRFFDPGAWWGLCRAAKESLATMQWGQDRSRRPARAGCEGGINGNC
jgi:hypothetical protein